MYKVGQKVYVIGYNPIKDCHYIHYRTIKKVFPERNILICGRHPIWEFGSISLDEVYTNKKDAKKAVEVWKKTVEDYRKNLSLYM